MDALSIHPVSSLRPILFLSPNPNNPHLLKPPPSSSNPTLPSFPNTFSTKPKPPTLSLTSKPLPLPFPTLFPLPLPKPAVQTHRKASTGYAAALLDVARCDGALGIAAKDVRRFKKAVHAVLKDEKVEEKRKGEVLKKVAEQGGFYGKLVVLVRMLVGKGKVGVVGEVLEEFGRMWEELSGIQRVVVVKERRVEGGEVVGMVKNVPNRRLGIWFVTAGLR